MWGRKKNEQGGPPFSQLADNIGGLALEPAFPSSSFPSTPLGGGGLDAAPPSLRETVKKRLLNDMIRNFAGEAAGVVMLVDSFTVRILSSVCKMSELLDENIHLVENITMKAPNGEYLRRQAMPVRAPRGGPARAPTRPATAPHAARWLRPRRPARSALPPPPRCRDAAAHQSSRACDRARRLLCAHRR